MSRTAAVLLAVAALVLLAQWSAARVSTHVDPRLIPLRSRRRVARLVSHPAQLRLACGLIAVLAIGAQLAVALD